jgi:hypothetical protein
MESSESSESSSSSSLGLISFFGLAEATGLAATGLAAAFATSTFGPAFPKALSRRELIPNYI